MYTEDYFSGLEELLGAEGMGMATTIIGIFLVAYILLMIVGILNYVFTSLALYTVGKRRGLKLYGMGWVPVGQQWLLGCIADQYDRKAKGKDKKLGKFLLIGYIIAIVVAIVAAVVVIVGALGMATAEIMGAATSSGSIAALVVAAILLLLTYIFLIVWIVFYFIALFKYFKSCSPKNAVWMLVLSILIGGLFTSICMLCVRKKDGGFDELKQDEESAEEPVEQLAEAPAEEPVEQQEFTYNFTPDDSEEE